MRLPRLYLAFTLVILVTCEQSSDESTDPEDESSGEADVVNDRSTEDTTINDKVPRETDQLPILPPIILLDFANDLDSSNSSGDEKTKRTIDSSLGYGFGRNDLFSGKYNYYFPAGKSGTAVSIEESISPFPPTTIIESVKPITENPYQGDGDRRNPTRQGNHQPSGSPQANRQIVQTSGDRFLGAQPVFGQRTKLYKPSQIDYGAYSESHTTARPDYRTNTNTTPQPGLRSGYTSGFSQDTPTSQRPYIGFPTQAPPAYVTPTSSSQTRYTLNDANSYSSPRSPNHDSLGYNLGSPLSSFDNLPRFTVENGVRYENKIVWKYPNGQISQTPPTSYMNSYNEFLTKQYPRLDGNSGNPNPGGFQSSTSESVYQNSGGSSVYLNQESGQTSFRDQNYQSGVRYQPQGSRYPSESLGNIYSKSPAQFPKDQELGNSPRPSQFISSASFSSGVDYGVGSRPEEPHDQSYVYQGQFGQKNTRPSASSGSSSGQVLGYDGLLAGNSGKRRPIPKYAINSPNPEYLPKPTESSSILTPSGTLSPQILSKYSRQAQRYLTKVFAPEKSATAPDSYSSHGIYDGTTAPEIDTSYENLLSYNPSISQYIRNPSSILNAKPTYIQAGNSLIPVIILRVDGTPPIRTKTEPNINLKALLQQYLTQYAGNVARNPDYEIGNGHDYGVQSAPQNPLQELAQLTQSLVHYSRNPSIADNVAKRLAGNLHQQPYRSNSHPRPATSNNGATGKTGNPDGLGKYETTKIKKVKSVQIIEDPRFTSYKVNS